jgi:hypothetical protein
MTQIDITWNLLAEAKGKHETGDRAIQTASLSGYALDYVLAVLCQLPVVQIRYLSPDFRIAEVWAQEPTHQELQLWSPSQNPVLAKKVWVKLNNTDASCHSETIANLRSYVEMTCGSVVYLPFPILAKSP